jgi:AraC-like DNA-binding protein
MRKCIFLIFLFLFTNARSQIQDSLQAYTYNELANKILKQRIHFKEAKNYIDYYLQRAKKEDNTARIVSAFMLYNKIFEHDDEKRLIYLDSAILYSKKSPNKFLPANLYRQKGVFYHTQNKKLKAMENYALALESIKKIPNKKSEYIIKFNIAFLKRALGDPKEAEVLFLECLAHEETQKGFNKSRSYNEILYHLSAIYYETKEFDKCTAINKKGIALAQNNAQLDQYYRFVTNEGINLTIQKKHNAAIDSIQKGLPHIVLDTDLMIARFYLAKNYHALGEEQKALNFFKAVDTLFNKTNDLHPSLRTAYEYLISDTKKHKQKDAQLYYTNQLLKVDSLLHKNYKNLSKKIVKQYDIPELLTSKKELIQELKQTNTLHLYVIWMVILLLLIALIGLFYYRRLLKRNQTRYDVVIQESALKKIQPVVSKETAFNDVKVQKVLEALKQFEKEKQFLTNRINIHDAAKLLQTNSKHLSKIINTHKGKSFTAYINDLRIEYLIDRIQHDPVYQKYTIKAIAEEGGFTNRETFYRIFKKKTGLKPSYFIKKVRNTT